MKKRIIMFLAAVVAVCGGVYADVPTLAHRWSFNGDYTDSVGGTSAEMIGSTVGFNESNTAVVMSGDGNGEGSLNLGLNMFPTDVPEVTVEIWATETAVKNWSRIFDYGSDNKNYLTLTWSKETDGNADRSEVRKNNGAVFACDNTMAAYALNTQYHISVTFSANEDGSTSVRWMRRNVRSGVIEKSGATIASNWTLADIASPKFYLGHSQYTNNADANAIYDEVRVWRGLLTDDQLTASVLAGPDALPDVDTFAEPTVTDVVAKQRYPWNGLVDITCKVAGISGATNELEFVVAAVMPDSGEVRKASHFWVVRDGTNSTDRMVYTNGNYRLLWDAKADLGQVLYSNMVVRVTLKTHGKVQLWAGGPYWAETNIGADEPWEYGYYFWWGDTVGYKREGNAWVASDGSSPNFSFGSGNTPTCNKSIATLKSEGWITADSVLVPDHDAAHVHWGGAWRMPTRQELDDLVSKCDWTWTMLNGVKGYVVKGKGDYASASIFLPAAGYGDGTSLYRASSLGLFWSSVPYSDDSYAWYLYFYSGFYRTYYSIYRYDGHSVRPVQGFTE